MDSKVVLRWCLTISCLLLSACGSTEDRLRDTFARQTTGRIQLPRGVIEISSPLVLAKDAHDLEIVGSGTVLKEAANFKGRAILIGEGVTRITISGFSIEGSRDASNKAQEMAPPENAFRVFYSNSGILFDQTDTLDIHSMRISKVSSFPMLISRSKHIRIHDLEVEDSGSLNAKGRNNFTGGIVIEEGSADFEVRDSNFVRIRGNALWTHSLFTSPRLEAGGFFHNHFDTIGRDAIQVGQASRVQVEKNTGRMIGYPPEIVDVENQGTPVAIDTAGNVDDSGYSHNQFEEINGKCIDLDGFHDGWVRENRCTNRGRAEEYPTGHYGVVTNNTHPDAHSANIEIIGNVIDGAKFGGVFLMGSGNTVTGNQFLRVNLAGCNETTAAFGCLYMAGEPDLLRSGIYLSRGVARPEQTKGNVIEDNTVTGHGMKDHCIVAGPGVSLAENRIEGNQCRNGD